MISTIIPTLWQSEKIHDTISNFKKSGIGELILIDNANSTFEDSEITVIKPNRNLGVNPAWNLGVSIARYDTICLLNDDITVNLNLVLKSLPDDYGLVGFDANENFSEVLNLDTDILEFEETSCKSFGFGCMMIFPKKNYKFIPSDLKIFFGDDLIYYINKDYYKRKVYNIKNLKAVGELSATSKSYEFLLQQELPYFDEFIYKLNTQTI